MKEIKKYIGYDIMDYMRYKKEICNKDFWDKSIRFEDFKEFIHNSKKHRIAIQEFYNTYKEKYLNNEIALCELRVITAWAMWSLDENIRITILCADFYTHLSYEELLTTKHLSKNEWWEADNRKKMWETSCANVEKMHNIAISKNYHSDKNHFKYFDFDTETRMPVHGRLKRVKPAEEAKKKNAIGFTAEINSVDFDDNQPSAKMGFIK